MTAEQFTWMQNSAGCALHFTPKFISVNTTLKKRENTFPKCFTTHREFNTARLGENGTFNIPVSGVLPKENKMRV